MHTSGGTWVPRLMVVLGAAMLMAAPAYAQTPLSVEARVGGSVGYYGAARGEVDGSPRPAWRVGVAGTLRPGLQIVASYADSGFNCRGGFCADSDVSFRSAGPELAVRWGPTDPPARGWWIQGEVLGHGLRSRWSDGSRSSGVAPGWGMAAGYRFPFRDGMAFTPGIRLQGYRAALDPDPESHGVYLAAAEVGVTIPIRR